MKALIFIESNLKPLGEPSKHVVVGLAYGKSCQKWTGPFLTSEGDIFNSFGKTDDEEMINHCTQSMF